MFRNYFLIAFRSIKKDGLYAFINIIGLTIGITVFLVIGLLVTYELSYDRFHEQADRIYRVDWKLNFADKLTYNAAVTPPMAEALVNDYPEVEAAARFRYLGSFHFRAGQENLSERDVVYADNDIFKIFTIPFVAGDPATALKEPYSMVISEQCAKRFFPDEDPMGKLLIKDNRQPYKITGICKDLPSNSHFHYRIFLSMEGLPESKNNNWIGGPFNTYILLREGAKAENLEPKLEKIVTNYVFPHAQSVLGKTFMDQFGPDSRNNLQLLLMPLLDIHLYSHLRNELEGNGDILNIYLLSAIALFILIIACINYINLSTAQSANRANEVGIRKVLGSGKSSLVLQFILESLILTSIAVLLSLALTEFALKFFNSMIGTALKIPWASPVFYLLLVSGTLLVGLLAGFYPAIVLSGFQPLRVMKGKSVSLGKSYYMRSVLVSFQFFISIVLIAVTIAFYQQMNFIQNKKLGFNKEQVIIFKNHSYVKDQLTVFKDEISRLSFIKSATVSSYFPGPGSARSTPLIWNYGAEPQPDGSINIEKWLVDATYIPTMDMEVVQGRNFGIDSKSDSGGVILNQIAVKLLGIADDPIGRKVSLFYENEDGSLDRSRVENWTIVGVVRDFNFESLHQSIAPLGLFYQPQAGNFIAFKFEAAHTDRILQELKSSWKKIAPGEPFIYSFLDDDFASLYKTEQKINKVFTLFSGLAILIACLGLFGLVAFTIQKRTKEIGIRKVLGASVVNIISLLVREFSRLIVLAIVISIPVSVYFINWYLQEFAYRIKINPLWYLLAGAFTFLIATVVMMFQSLKAAHSNPVESLKSD